MSGNGIVILVDPPRIVAVGTQGPQGPPGAGSVYYQEAEPSPIVNGDLWITPSTKLFKARVEGAWEAIVYRTQLADATETLDINAGFF